ncbi:Syntaxin-21 [Hibiscus syriacus]|uniref:Syntaxin-21 n=1 Tax=Hibiscus syriacus TaxID=106335 RepID=A0A6A2ZKQ8_HIBSY|nr:syntaxin-21-like isoform X1 [Hibiscus syriacus]KAE8692561.1 Syntaxin-21 [Hibiscus syriacus]
MSFQDLEAGLARPHPNNYLNSSQRKPTQDTEHASASQSVAAGIFKIRTAILAFDRLVNSLGTLKDTVELRSKLHKTRLHIGQLVKETSAKLREASEADQDAEVSPLKKIADAKLAKDFQAALKDFQKAQRLAAERETAYSPSVPKEVLPSSYDAYEVEKNSSKSLEHQQLLVTKGQEVVLLENEITFNEAIIEEREQGIKEVQQEISEVNEIFKDLAVLVHEQGAMIDDIGSNVENSHAATVQATYHLKKASKIQRANSSTRCLLVLIFGIILLIFIVVVVA